MKKQLSLLAVFVSFCLFSCQEKNILDVKANAMAVLECRAVSLREQRFQLANQLRFAQDSLLQLKNGGDSIQLTHEIHDFNLKKEDLLQQSLRLADTIHLALDSLRKFVFVDQSDKEKFDQKLKVALERRGCK